MQAADPGQKMRMDILRRDAERKIFEKLRRGQRVPGDVGCFALRALDHRALSPKYLAVAERVLPEQFLATVTGQRIVAKHPGSFF